MAAALAVLLGTVGLAACVADAPPLIGTAVAGNGEVTVSWSPPVVSEVIVAYLVTPHPADAPSMPRVRFDSVATTQTVSGLTNGVTYTFTVQAVNSLGHRSAASEESNPVTPTAPPAALAVTTGSFHACAVLTVGTVGCWGDNGSGQLGEGTTTDSPTLVTVTGISTATAIAAGFMHTCAVLAAGTVECWGLNDDGQLGNGTTTDSTTPVTVSGITTATAISAAGTYGTSHACAVLADGTVQCWGDNVYGQLGNGTNTGSATPVTVTGITTATAISVSDSYSCALLEDGTVQCWGDNETYQLGSYGGDSTTPLAVTGISTATVVTTGSYHACALLEDGTVACWGLNHRRQLGYAGPWPWPESTWEPVLVEGIPFFGLAAIGIDAGGHHSCAVMAGGSVRCWGDLGGTSGTASPTRVPGLADVSEVSTNGGYSCAVLTGGTVKCWSYPMTAQFTVIL
ncbi:MAG: fibronectin type III domain-containing protein [Acidimicrobiales bacterium]